MIDPIIVSGDAYWLGIKSRTFVDSGRYSDRISIIENGIFIIHVDRKGPIIKNRCCHINGIQSAFEDVLDFLRDSEHQVDRDAYTWFLFHIDEFV